MSAQSTHLSGKQGRSAILVAEAELAGPVLGLASGRRTGNRINHTTGAIARTWRNGTFRHVSARFRGDSGGCAQKESASLGDPVLGFSDANRAVSIDA